MRSAVAGRRAPAGGAPAARADLLRRARGAPWAGLARRRPALVAAAGSSVELAADTRDAPPAAPAALAKMRVAELRKELDRRGVRHAGARKAQLVELLAGALRAEGEASAAAVSATRSMGEESDSPNGGGGHAGEQLELEPRAEGQAQQEQRHASGGGAQGERSDGRWQPSNSEVTERYRHRSGQVVRLERGAHLGIPTGLELCFLGTSGGAPTLRRSVSCIALNTPTTSWMVDCGEGSQMRIMQSASVKLNKIDRVFITHLHGDHIFGLPGLICGLSAVQKQEAPEKRTPLRLYGPKGLATYVRAALATSYTRLSMPVIITELVDEEQAQGLGEKGRSGNKDGTIVVRELVGKVNPDAAALMPSARPTRSGQEWRVPFEHGLEWDVCADDELGISVHAAPLKHAVPCIGYAFVEASRRGRFNPDAARALGLPPGPLFKALTRGESVEYEGKVVQPEDVLSKPRRGRKVVVLGDTYEPRGILRLARNADLLVHEATFADGPENDPSEMRRAIADATRKGHSTAGMAGRFARDCSARHLVLTHFSARFEAPPESAADLESEGRDGMQEDKRHVGLLKKQAQRAFGSGQIWCANDWDRFMLEKWESGTE